MRLTTTSRVGLLAGGLELSRVFASRHSGLEQNIEVILGPPTPAKGVLRVLAFFNALLPGHTLMEASGENLRCLIDSLAIAINQGSRNEADRSKIASDLLAILTRINDFGAGALGPVVKQLSSGLGQDALEGLDLADLKTDMDSLTNGGG